VDHAGAGSAERIYTAAAHLYAVCDAAEARVWRTTHALINHQLGEDKETEGESETREESGGISERLWEEERDRREKVRVFVETKVQSTIAPYPSP